MSILREAIDARSRGIRPEPTPAEVDLDALKHNAIGVIGADGRISISPTGDDEEDRRRIRSLERIRDWDSYGVPVEVLMRASEYHAGYEASRLRQKAKDEALAEKRRRKREGSKEKEIASVREEYI